MVETMKAKNILLIISAACITSCNSWMDVKPENERLSQQYWTEESDVETTVTSCYSRLRGCLEKMVQWGEIRADIIQVRNTTALEESIKMKEQNIDSDNTLVKWDPFYKVINSANAVIQYSQLVLERDPNFTAEKMDYYMAEAKTLRALAYFYLVRTFREVPLILEPYVSDVQALVQPKATEEALINQILTDLRWSMKRIKEKHITNESSSNLWQNKGRATRYLAAALLADVYLWNEQYAECIDACNVIINSGEYRLIAADLTVEEYEDDNWFNDIFGNKYSDESIFELYYATGQGNSLLAWFNGASSNDSRRYYMSTELVAEFAEFARDVRGEYSTFISDESWASIWKHIGLQQGSMAGVLKRTSTGDPANWIIYRLAEIYLIRAEAYTMQNNFAAGVRDLNTIRQRARLGNVDASSMGQKELLFEILNERKKEFVGEGKRWYDLVRIAKKEDFTLYKSDVLDVLLTNVSVNERPIYLTRLSDNNSLFLPIFKDEITMGKGVLVQNPAYQ